MDRLRLCLETLRRLAKETEDPNCVVLAEREINGYLQNEIDALRAALERLGKAIDEEARKGQGKDWSLMVGYVQSCRFRAQSTNGRKTKASTHRGRPIWGSARSTTSPSSSSTSRNTLRAHPDAAAQN
jgi:hypothetical protein